MKIGSSVHFTRTLRKTKTYTGGRKITDWKAEDHTPIEGVYIGVRYYPTGSSRHDYEYGWIFKRTGTQKAFLVVTHERQAPVACDPESVTFHGEA